jgi:hypothetical protein
MGSVEDYSGGIDKIAAWDFRNNFVQSNVDPAGSFVRGASILLAAGPPSLSQASSTFESGSSGGGAYGGVLTVDGSALAGAYPIGLLDNVGIGQNKGLQQIFEIGSDRRYFIPGRTISQISMSRVMFDGPSIMKVLFHHYFPAKDSFNNPAQLVKTGSADGNEEVIKNLPGFDQTFLNLGSELFNRPIGLLMLFHNTKDEGVAAVYLEYCFLRAHQFNISASSTLVAESIQADFDRMVPINMNHSRNFSL